jgi:hypothetical protein
MKRSNFVAPQTTMQTQVDEAIDQAKENNTHMVEKQQQITKYGKYGVIGLIVLGGAYKLSKMVTIDIN